MRLITNVIDPALKFYTTLWKRFQTNSMEFQEVIRYFRVSKYRHGISERRNRKINCKGSIYGRRSVSGHRFVVAIEAQLHTD